MYREKEVSSNDFAKLVGVLDLDEGIRIENKENLIFLNKNANRYCVNISTEDKDEFFYYNSEQQVLSFLKERMDSNCKIFSY